MGLGLDSGPYSASGDQWNVWDTPYNSANGNTYFGQRSVGFYVAINPYYGQATSSPTPEPTTSPTSTPTISPTGSVVTLLGSSPLQLERNQQIGVVHHPTSNFIISFTLRPLGTVNNWGYYGVRSPAMWFHRNSYKLHFTYYTSHGQKHYDLDGTFSANQDFDIKIEAIGNYIKFYVNDVQKFSLGVSHTYRLDQSLPLRVYAGDNHHQAANARISNVVYTPLQ